MRYFHGSQQAFPLNFILRPQANGYCHWPENAAFEAFVESLRPEEKLSRSKSVFLCAETDLIDAAGGYVDCIYEVRPGPCVQGSDLAWYSEASSYFGSDRDGDVERASDLIRRYWSGEPYVSAENSCFEYRTWNAKIIRYEEINMDRDEFEEGLLKLRNADFEVAP